MSIELRMSPWQEPGAPAPQAAGVAQVKVLGALLEYPTGKSAMVWYGHGPDLTAIVAEGLAAAEALLKPGTILRWRCVATPDPQPYFETLLTRFSDRFGAAPTANQRITSKDTPQSIR